MMRPRYIHLKVNGVPYCADKVTGDREAPKRWRRAIVQQTQGLPKVRSACIAKITFLLPQNKFPTNLPYGSDLDNLLKLFLDALNDTVFSKAKGKDSCVISMNVSKTRVESEDEAGVLLEILPVRITQTVGA